MGTFRQTLRILGLRTRIQPLIGNPSTYVLDNRSMINIHISFFALGSKKIIDIEIYKIELSESLRQTGL